MDKINKIAVIGAGVMGAGIAAQAANAGVEVLLLDIVPKGATDRSAIAKGAIAKLKKAKPAAFMHPANAKRVTPGNTEDDLAKIAECDWVIEAVIENLSIKRDLYQKIEKHKKKGAVVSSNTSTLPLADLTKGFSEDFRKHFLITHFFNPPRYMRLLEIVTGPETCKKAEATVRHFADHSLGKSLVDCNDTPGFIANRIGTYWLHAAVVKAMERNIGVEEADAVLSRPAGVPRTGVFGLLDLVGLDLMPHILQSMRDTLPKTDPFQELGPAPALLEKMIAEGYTGRKGKGGFYRLNTEGGKKVKEVINLKTGDYTPARRPKPAAAKRAGKPDGLRALVEHGSPEGQYAWDVLSNTLSYAASLVPEIAANIELVDRAMRLGYNWKLGPFELIDKMGTSWLATRLEAEGRPVPSIIKVAAGRKLYTVREGRLHYMSLSGDYTPVERPEGVLLLEDVKRATKPLARNVSASLWDVGEGVACLEFHSKMNSLDPFSLTMVERALKEVPRRGFKGLVIYNEGNHFSVGANLLMLLITSTLRLWGPIESILKRGQGAFQKMKYAPFPVVGAPSGMALGGGCETLLHCDALTAHAETYTGLVEAGVGVVPGWGGCKEMLGRWQQDGGAGKGPMPPVTKAFEIIATAKVATSAQEARDLLFLRPHDEVVMNRDRLLAAAKAKVLKLAENYTPPEPYTFHLPGETGRTALGMALRDFVQKGLATPHDVVVAESLGQVLTGGDTDLTRELDEDAILKLERKALVGLTKTKGTRARIWHMLKNGKPLRN